MILIPDKLWSLLDTVSLPSLYFGEMIPIHRTISVRSLIGVLFVENVKQVPILINKAGGVDQ